MDSTPTKSLRRRSPLATLDPVVLRELCELHPWDLGRLSAASGFDRSVLSHVFAGRRSLPQNAASTFLSLIGLLPTGEPNKDHLFVFQARVGNSALLKSWLERLLPNGTEVVALHRSDEYGGISGAPGGWALFDGETAVLVLDAVGAELPVSGDRWPVLGDVEKADLLLDTENLPDRSQFVEAVSDVPSVDRRDVSDPGWELVKRAAARKGLSPSSVLGLIEDHQFPSLDGVKSLFPLVRRKRERLRKG